MLSPRGFTLIELAVVLAVIGLMLGGALIPLGTIMENSRRTDAKAQLADLVEALYGFAQVQGRLPCPADPAIASGTTGAGQEDCSRAAGVIPWATLGRNETDPWGSRFSYRVTPAFTTGGLSLSASGDMTVTSPGGVILATGIPAVLVSHGRNRWHANLPSGTRMPDSGNAGENANDLAGTTFVGHADQADFDDMVFWISPYIFFGRMIAAGRLP
jgi:prepilin-type N-terminal cleavage/methylation domain-containing protein